MGINEAFKAFDRVKRARLRLLRKVEIEGRHGCWIWKGTTRGNYGVMYLEGRIRNAHRAAYALFVAPVADGVSVIHSCPNKLCCCPDHLYLDVQERLLTPGMASAE